MPIARTLLIAATLLPWPWIVGAPQAAPMPSSGIVVRVAPNPLRLVADHDHDRDQDHPRHRHHHHQHHRHDRDHDRGDQGH